MTSAPLIVWIRRDLRLADHAALSFAASRGPVIPVFIHDELTEDIGAAAQWRFGAGLAQYARTLGDHGSRLILRRGRAVDVLRALLAETGASGVVWQRAYDPASVTRDTAVKSMLHGAGLIGKSFAGHLLFEPWSVETKTGGFYRVYTPFWRAVAQRSPEPLLPIPALTAPAQWPASDTLDDWRMGQALDRGAVVLARHACVGEAAALDRLDRFVQEAMHGYKTERNAPAKPATSRLSENLTYGEISPARAWAAGQAGMSTGVAGAEHFCKELVWRDFAYHLMWHTPEILTRNWRPEWDGFSWSEDADDPALLRWQQGRTGYPFVDAALREMYVTGTMHNRGRMIVGSFLTKHLLLHWRFGRDWFANCLTDWDPASNAMGWQWTAGCGPDAAPYFRIFNPTSQLDKFDPGHAYPARWIAEGTLTPHADGLSFFDAVPRSWGLSQNMPYPSPLIELAEGRARALEAYANRPVAGKRDETLGTALSTD